MVVSAVEVVFVVAVVSAVVVVLALVVLVLALAALADFLFKSKEKMVIFKKRNASASGARHFFS
ncbi:Uncharacterised protein [Bacillus freudenreichii]|nr:Uncharacterised protein [Bacillus freudenreichii]